MRFLLALLLTCLTAGAQDAGFFQWTPPQKASLIWWAASPSVTLSNTDVTTWTPYIGGSISQVTNTQRPTITSNALGNYPVIAFNSTNLQCFNTTQSSTNLFDMANTNITIVVVFHEQVATTAILFGSSAANSTSSLFIFPDYSGSTHFDSGGSTSTNQSRVSLTNLVWTGGYHVGIFTRSNSALKAMWKDGTNQATYVNGTTFGTTSSTMAIGTCIGGGTQMFNGQIAEFFVFAGNATANEISMISRAMGKKYGFSVQ